MEAINKTLEGESLYLLFSLVSVGGKKVMRELKKRGGKTLVIAIAVVVTGLLLAVSAAGVAYKASENTVFTGNNSTILLMKKPS